MRLLTVGSLPPEWGGPVRGGAATFHAALLTELGRRNDVEVVGVLPPGPLDREIPVPAWVRPQGVGRADFYEQLLERLRPDVVLMNHFAHTVGATHARLGSPVPAIGVAQSWHGVTFSEGEKRVQALALTREAIGGLGGLVAVSRCTAEEGRRLGFEYPPIAETIPNPVPPLYMEDGLDVTAGERDGVLFLGSLIQRKRPEALVRAAAQALDAPVLLVGEGELEEDLCAEIAALGVESRVRLAAPPGGDGHLIWVREGLLHSRVMCLPSRSEGLPLAFVEALACGTPIVGFGPAVREIRDELGVSVGEPLDGDAPEEIATAIENVLSAEWDRRQLRRATLDAFGLDRVGSRYVSILERVAAEGGGVTRMHGGQSTASAERPAAIRGTPICVLGPSRSGTSLTARLLNLAGVDLGPEEELLGEERHQLVAEGDRVMAKAEYSNPGGHWEHYRLMRLNERILRALGGTWREPPPMPDGWESSAELDDLREEARGLLAESFAGRELWGWKDPRNSLTLPFWRSLLPDVRCVICLRHPLEVAESLRDRDGIEVERGVEQWTRYLAAALVNSVGLPRLVIRYEDYFREPATTAARLARFAGRAGVFDDPAGRGALSEAIDATLWRHRHANDGPPGQDALPAGAVSLLHDAERIARSGEGAAGPDPQGLAAEIRRRLGPPPEAPEWPLVSIVVLNRDGAPMLRRLLAGLAGRTDYPRLELILVDNGSSDDSLDFIRRVEAPFPISIVANPHNESFSDGCNQGAELAHGDLLLFLNNDVEPFEAGWLRELVACLRTSGAGAVSSTLVCLDEEHETSLSFGYGVQHRGLEFREEDGMLVPALRGWEADPLDERLGVDDEPPAVAAACVLVDRGAFERAGGFSRGYVYGAEDIDLCLKLRAAGLPVRLSGRSIAIHHPVSTRRIAPFEEEHARKLANRLVLWERWGPQLRREYELTRLGEGGEWPLGVCIKAADPTVLPDLDAVRAAIESRGYRCLLLEGEHTEDPVGLNYEVAVHCAGSTRDVPKPGQVNVLWDAARSQAPRASLRACYDVHLDGADTEQVVARLLAAVEGARSVIRDRPPPAPGGWFLAATDRQPGEARGPGR